MKVGQRFTISGGTLADASTFSFIHFQFIVRIEVHLGHFWMRFAEVIECLGAFMQQTFCVICSRFDRFFILEKSCFHMRFSIFIAQLNTTTIREVILELHLIVFIQRSSVWFASPLRIVFWAHLT